MSSNRYCARRPAAAGEAGQIFPILLMAMVAIIAVAMILFQVGSATELKAQGQTGADAGALAAAKNVSDQVIAADGSFAAIDDDQIRAAAADYAQRNQSQVLSVERDGCAVTVQVRTRRTLEGRQAEEAGVQGRFAVATARAEMIGSGPGGAIPLDGEIPEHLKEVAGLAASLGLQVTSSTGGQHAEGSLHYQALAIDVAGAAPGMAAFYRAITERYEGQILELFYDPLGGIDNNQEIGAVGKHGDHVHVALPPSIGSPGGGDDDDDDDRDASGEDDDDEPGDDSGDDDLDLGAGTLGTGGGGARLIALDQPSMAGCTGALGLGGIPGFGDGKFAPDTSSIKIAQAICRVGERLDVSGKVMLAAYETAIVESGARNLPDGHLDSAGVFQQRPSQGWGDYHEVTDVNYAARQFFTRAKRAARPGQSAGQLAQTVQGSAFPERYDQNRGGAVRLLKASGCRT